MKLVEGLIIRKCIADLLSAGFYITVNDGGEDVVKASRDPDAIFKAMGTTDEDYLVVSRRPSRPGQDGWVRFIYGNRGPEVISDYTTGLEAVLKDTNDLSDQIDSGDGEQLLALFKEYDAPAKELASLRLSVRRIAEVLGVDGEPKLEIPPEGQERGWNALCSAICDRIEWNRRYQ